MDGRDAGAADAGAVDASARFDAGASDSSAPDSGASDAGPSDAGNTFVRWITELEPRTIDGDIGLDFGFQYELAIDGDPSPYTLTFEQCIQIAGQAESCTSSTLSNVPGTRFIRFGIDPSMYGIGDNFYRFRLILERGGVVVDEDLLELELTVTSCNTCVGS